MKTLGIIGGMSPESTTLYYRIINRELNHRLGGNHSADIVMHSVDFEEVVRLQKSGDWEAAGALLAASAAKLEGAGAQLLLVATNTMHKVAAPIQAAIGVPFLHILDSVAERIRAQGIRAVGLLGTRFTMQDAFYREGLAERGIQAIVPDEGAQAEIHRIIFEELCVGHFPESSRRFYVQTIERLADQGAEGIILGCTEIGLLVRPEDTAAPLFDTTAIHVQAAAEFILRPA